MENPAEAWDEHLRSIQQQPTALSAAITELERILLRQILIRRKAHGVSLTPTGSFVHNRAAELLDLADEMQLSAASGGARLKRSLAMGCYFSLATKILPALLERFGALHPDVDIVFIESSQDDVKRRLMAGELDVAIVYDVDLGSGLLGPDCSPRSCTAHPGRSFCLLRIASLTESRPLSASSRTIH